jgi:hypothetical protein
MARIAQSLLLQADEVLHLESLLRRRTLEDRIARRCRALLLAAQGMSNVEIAVKLDMADPQRPLRRKVVEPPPGYEWDGMDPRVDTPAPGFRR